MNADTTIVALGANRPSEFGPPKMTLERALSLLDDAGVRVLKRARWRRTPAFPSASDPEFVNGAALLLTNLSAEKLLALIHEIEACLGRERGRRWGPRVCDIDLIAHGDSVTPDPETVRELMALGARAAEAPAPDRLILPHPRLHERAFVLAPVADIAPDWRHPLTGLTVAEMLAALPARAREEVEIDE